MSKARVIKAVFYRRGIQVGMVTGSFVAGTTDEAAKTSLIEAYRWSCREYGEFGPPDDDEDMDERDRELEAQINEKLDSPDKILNLTEDGRKEYGGDG